MDLEIDLIKFRVSLHEINNPLCVNPLNHSVTDSRRSESESGVWQDITLEIDQTQRPVRLAFAGKQQNDTRVDESGSILDDAWIEIHSVWVDGILIEPWALGKMCEFFPEYSDSHREYAQAHGMTLAESVWDSTRFYFNGTWILDLDRFFQRYHEILTSGFQGYNKWIRISHLGMVDPTAYKELSEILDQLNQ